MKIYLRIKEKADADWFSKEYTVAQIPAIGEYVVPASSSEWYQVTAVVYTLFPEAEFVAEVYAVLTSQVAAAAKAGRLLD